MVAVRLWGSLIPLAEDTEEIDVEAKDIRELFRKLVKRYPALQTAIDSGIAVSIDGEIYRDNWSQELPEKAEVFLMRRLSGG